MLELRARCQGCDRDLPPDSMEVYICSFECTFCAACAESKLGGICPNCGGELVRRPRRPADKLAGHPASTSRENVLETRIPPPLAGLIMGIIAWLASSAFAPTTLSFPVRLGAAIVFVVIGLVIAGTGARTISRAKTTLNPVKPETASALVTSGIYQRSRNPMYLGMAAWLLAWSAWLGTPAGLIGVPLFMLYMNRFQIRPEERALSALFGADFAAYCARVRRWL